MWHALPVCDLWYLEDLEEEDVWLNQLINDWITKVFVEQPSYTMFVKYWEVTLEKTPLCEGHPPSADLRYEEEDSISLSTPIIAAIKG